MAQHLAAEPLVQNQQAGFRSGLGPAQLVPVLGRDHHLQRLAQQGIEVFGLRDHQLPLPQGSLLPGLDQLAMVEQPEAGIAGWTVTLEAGQGQARVGAPEPGQLHLQQPLALGFAHHQSQGAFAQGQGHQQADPPTRFTARCQPHQGVVAAAQAAGHQPAEAQVVGPGFAALTLQQRLELLVGAGFEHSQAANGPKS